MIYDPGLRGVLRYIIMDYGPYDPASDTEEKRVAGPFTDDECAAYLRAHREGAEGCCWFVWTFDMDGYQDEELWRLVPPREAGTQDWMRSMRYSMEVIEDYQLPLLEQGGA